MSYIDDLCGLRDCKKAHTVAMYFRRSRRCAQAHRADAAAFYALQSAGEAVTCGTECRWRTVALCNLDEALAQAEAQDTSIPWTEKDLFSSAAPAIPHDDDLVQHLRLLGAEILEEPVPEALSGLLSGAEDHSTQDETGEHRDALYGRHAPEETPRDPGRQMIMRRTKT